MLTEQVIIRGRDLEVIEQPALFDDVTDSNQPRQNPKRRRPPEYTPSAPSGVDLGQLIELLSHTNPHWSPEANDWDTESNPPRRQHEHHPSSLLHQRSQAGRGGTHSICGGDGSVRKPPSDGPRRSSLSRQPESRPEVLEPAMDNDDEPTRWVHRKGDEYRVVIASAWLNGSGHGINYYPQPQSHPTLAAAIHEGFTEHERSDDFNVGVWRNGELVALLWMDEIVDDDPAVMAKVEA